MKMFRILVVLAGASLGAAALAQGAPPAPPPPTTPEPTVHDLRPAHVPLVAEPLDPSQPSAAVWFKGERPATATFAKLTLKPVDVVVLEKGLFIADAKPVVLWRAVAGDEARFASRVKLADARAERLYCGSGGDAVLGGRLFCLLDADRDGRFEALAFGTGEASDAREQLSIIGPRQSLPAPLAYRAARADEAGSIEAAYTNCAKDHDRPRFSFAASRSSSDIAELKALAAALRAEPAPGAPAYLANFKGSAAQMARLNALLGRQDGGQCRAAEPLAAGEAGYPASGLRKGALAARLGELAIEVGSKDEGAPVKLLGMRSPDRLYRMVGGGVEPLSETVTRKQTQLAIQQKFDKPVVLVNAGAEVREGARRVGDVVLTLPIGHGYMGVLTQDTRIRTLLSSRSLPAGTVLYGVPMAQRTVMTINGVPQSPMFGGGAAASVDNTRLVWCVPVEDEGKWTATCLPDQGGRYTLLKGQRPAFEVTSFSYDAGTSTNDGPAPVAERPGDFGKPLTWRFTIKALTPSEILLTQDTLFGDAVVHSRDARIERAAGGRSGLIVGRGVVALSGDGDTLTVAKLRDFNPGAEARVESALLRGGAASAGAPAAPVTAPGKM